MIDYSEIIRHAMYIAQISEDKAKRLEAELVKREETIGRWKTENRQLYEMFTEAVVLLKRVEFCCDECNDAGVATCPVCLFTGRHESDCKLSVFLEKHK